MRKSLQFICILFMLSSFLFVGCEGVNDVLDKTEDSSIFDANQSQSQQIPGEEPNIPTTGDEITTSIN